MEGVVAIIVLIITLIATTPSISYSSCSSTLDQKQISKQINVYALYHAFWFQNKVNVVC